MIRILSLLGLLILICCASPFEDPETEVVLDLVGHFELAETTVEIAALDLGTADARGHLGSGWSWNESGSDGTSFVWTLAKPSSLLFFLVEPRSFEIRFRCRPWRHEERSVRALSLRINDHQIQEIDLSRGWQEYVVPVSADLMLSGPNTLTLTPRWSPNPPPTTDARGKRQVAVAFDWIRFGRATPQTPSVDVAEARLTLTAGSRVDYYFDAPSGSALIIDSIQNLTQGKGTLTVSTRSESEQETVLLISESDSGRFQAHLPESPGLMAMRFQTKGHAVSLLRPRIVAPPAEQSSSPLEASRPEPGELRPQPSLVVLYLIDTLRADHVSGLDYHRDTTPALSAFMKEAVVFENTIAQSSWTKASVGSILTGHLPWAHGGERLKDALVGDLDLLPQHLQQADYRTAAFVANGMVGPAFGFDRGWDRFEMMPEPFAAAGKVNRLALSWLDTLELDRPLFLYIHTVDPHTPYDPAELYVDRFATDEIDTQIGSVDSMRKLAALKTPPEESLVEDLVSLYDGEIAAGDFEFSKLIEALTDRDLFDRTLFIVLSDHGEEFYDHGGWTHGRTLHRESLHVPFIIRFPGAWSAGNRLGVRAQQIDLLPTLLAYLNIEAPTGLPGQSLLCAIESTASGADADANCPVFAERPLFSGVHYYGSQWVSVILGDWKLIVGRIDALDREARLFHLAEDPQELTNLAPTRPVLVGYLTSLIRGELQSGSHRAESVEVELDEETEAWLDALGYLN